MITTVNNRRASVILSALLMISIALTCGVAYLGYPVPELQTKWYVTSAVVAGVGTSLHLSAILLMGTAISRLEIGHLVLFTLYTSILICCGVIPLAADAKSKLPEALQWRLGWLLFCCFAQLPGLLTVLVALYFKDNQQVQRWLHPLQELIDGFPKSQNTIAMKEVAPLEQVVVTDNQQPLKPSQILKTWPRGPPFPVKALYSFKNPAESELPFRRGDELMVLDCRGRWWHAQKDDAKGFIPSNYVDVLLKAEVKEDYAAKADDEVSVIKGQVIEVMERYDLKCLVRNKEAKIGGLPTQYLIFQDEQKATQAALEEADKENVKPPDGQATAMKTTFAGLFTSQQ